MYPLLNRRNLTFVVCEGNVPKCCRLVRRPYDNHEEDDGGIDLKRHSRSDRNPDLAKHDEMDEGLLWTRGRGDACCALAQVVGEPDIKPKWQVKIHENGARDLCFDGHITPSSVSNPA